MRLPFVIGSVSVAIGLAGVSARPAPDADVALFFQATSPNQKETSHALSELARTWRPGYAAMAIDLARFMVAPPTEARQPDPGTIDILGTTGDDRARARSLGEEIRTTGQTPAVQPRC